MSSSISLLLLLDEDGFSPMDIGLKGRYFEVSWS
jgi:hypothetical protein